MQTRAVGFTMKEGRAHAKDRADRVGFSGEDRFKGHPEVAARLGRDDLIDPLFLSHGPFLPIGALAVGNARALKARPGRHDQTALAVDVTHEGVEGVEEAIVVDVVPVFARVPAVVDDALKVGKVAGDAHDFVGGNARHLRGLAGREGRGFFGEQRIGRRHRHARAVGQGHVAVVRQVRDRLGRFDKAYGRTLFVRLDALPDDRVSLGIVHAVKGLAALRLNVGLRQGSPSALMRYAALVWCARNSKSASFSVMRTFKSARAKAPSCPGRIGTQWASP